MYDTEGAKGVMTRLVRRDGNFDSDYFELVIDGYHDHLSRAFFDLNPSGSKGDQIGIGTSCCDSVVGSDVGSARRTSTKTVGRRRSEFRTASFVSRATRCRRGDLQVRRFIKRQQRAGPVVVVGEDGSGRSAALRASRRAAHSVVDAGISSCCRMS